MKQTNQDVRQAIKKGGVYYWQVANELGLADNQFSRSLRFELPQDTKEQIYKAIEKIRKGA